MKKIVLSADSTCDLNEEIIERYDIQIQPLHVSLDKQNYLDGVDITPDDIYDTYNEKGILPQTASPNPNEYIDHFKKWTDEGYAIIHVSLGSSLSSSYQNSCLAAEELEDVYTIDSGNLSTGMGLLVVEAGERIKKGLDAPTIQEEVIALKSKVNASFVIDNLTYLHEGGRCSAIQAFSANLLNIRPSIEVDNNLGSMDVGKKYRGSLPKVIKRYTKDRLTKADDINTDRVFITHSGTSSEHIDSMKKAVEETTDFKEVIVTRAGCTISSHCGPNTLGVLFLLN